MLMLIAALALALQAGPSLQQGYEGVARDAFAAWSVRSGDVAISGSVRTASVQTLYNTPTAFNGNPTPVAYSLHQVAFNCQAQTAAFINGANYTQSGVLISPGAPTPSLPWTDGTTGFQQVAATVCAMNP